jgi:hypothetical protein
MAISKVVLAAVFISVSSLRALTQTVPLVTETMPQLEALAAEPKALHEQG